MVQKQSVIDRQRDDEQSDPDVVLCFAGATQTTTLVWFKETLHITWITYWFFYMDNLPVDQNVSDRCTSDGTRSTEGVAYMTV